MANLAGYNRLKYGVANKPRWEAQFPITDKRTEEQKLADKRNKAIQTCAKKIMEANTTLTSGQAVAKATLWYDKRSLVGASK